MTFDATKWLNNKLGLSLNDNSIRSVKDFGLIWNIFEDRACNNLANFQSLEKFVVKNLEAISKTENVTITFEYFRNRYVSGKEFSGRFPFLNLRKNDNPEFIERVLMSNDPCVFDKALVSLVIINRYRNNLFHGLKEMSEIEEQENNFKVANVYLTSLMDIAGIV